MHKTNARRVKRQTSDRATMVSEFMRNNRMTRTAAERLAKAVRHGLDVWAWEQGRVQFLSKNQIDLAMTHGLESWVERAVNGSDSADPFFTLRGGWAALRRYYPEVLAVRTRCAGRTGDHSTWSYGPVYLTKADALKAGHMHEIECNCWLVSRPLEKKNDQ